MTTIAGKLSRFTQKEIDAFFKNARCTLRYRGLVFLIAPQQNPAFGRILVITSRKVGNAPTRNKIRRQLKALYYENQYYAYGHDCVIIVKKESTLIPFAKLQDLLAHVMSPLASKST